MQTLILYILTAVVIVSCATPNESILTGAVVGGTAGTVLGHQHSGTSESRLTGALVGTAVGGLVGYLANKEKQKKATKTTPVKLDAENPLLTNPKVRMYWEPDQIEGNKYIEKHRVWVLESSPVWTKRP